MFTSDYKFFFQKGLGDYVISVWEADPNKKIISLQSVLDSSMVNGKFFDICFLCNPFPPQCKSRTHLGLDPNHNAGKLLPWAQLEYNAIQAGS